MIRTDNKSRELGAMDLYLNQIRGDDLLSAAQETTLARAIAAGDSDARAQMIRANLRLVVRIARDYRGRGLCIEDLIGEGNLGLIRATEEFDPSFGTRFSTYASYWIKQAIRHALTNTTTTIRLPAHMVSLLAKWRKTERTLSRELGQTPTFDQVATTLNLTDAQRVLIERARRANTLRAEGNDEEHGWSAESTDSHQPAPDHDMEAADERRQLWSRLDRLDPRERTILTLRFGLDDNEPMTLKEVGNQLGVTREWVRKIEIRAVQKLHAARNPEPAPAKAKKRRRVATPRRDLAPLLACQPV